MIPFNGKEQKHLMSEWHFAPVYCTLFVPFDGIDLLPTNGTTKPNANNSKFRQSNCLLPGVIIKSEEYIEFNISVINRKNDSMALTVILSLSLYFSFLHIQSIQKVWGVSIRLHELVYWFIGVNMIIIHFNPDTKNSLFSSTKMLTFWIQISLERELNNWADTWLLLWRWRRRRHHRPSSSMIHFTLSGNENWVRNGGGQMVGINIYDFYFLRSKHASGYICHLFLYSRQANYRNHTWSHVLTHMMKTYVMVHAPQNCDDALDRKNGAQIHKSGKMVVISTIFG